MKIVGLVVLLTGLGFALGARAECTPQQVAALQQRGATMPQIAQICGMYQQPAQATSNRCYSQAGVCMLPGFGPRGVSCWCTTTYGPSPGVVR